MLDYDRFDVLPDSRQSFYNSILVESLAALKVNTFLDNFDAARFNSDAGNISSPGRA